MLTTIFRLNQNQIYIREGHKKNFDSAIAHRVFSSLAQEQNFFDGDDPINQVCGCGNKDTCQPLVQMNCNCNANSEEWKKDQGRITAK